MKSTLFSPIAVGKLTLENRIVIPAMCQYSAENGQMTDWHLIHLGTFATSGAGIFTIEATAVTPEGRITYGDVGLWDDDCEKAMGRVLDGVRKWSDMPIAIQLGHAGRKASSHKPWDGGAQIAPSDPNGWQTVAPSAIPFMPEHNAPEALDDAGLESLRNAFRDAAVRAGRLGLDAIQIHGAHGYLLHQFLSPLSNQRTDAFGGSLENRMRFPLEIFEIVREAFPSDRPVTMRLSGDDWTPGGWTIEETIEMCKALEAAGADAVHISGGGLHRDQNLVLHPNYQVPMARAVKKAVNIPVIAVGLITEFEQAEAILATGDADMVGIARAALYDPRWPWHAAAHFGETATAPNQYLRSAPHRYSKLFIKD